MISRHARQPDTATTTVHRHGPLLQSSPLDASLQPVPLIQRALQSPASLTPAEVLKLHRIIGNRAVGQLVRGHLSRQTSRMEAQHGEMTVQPKLMVGPVGDPYEQEADRVAQQVVQRLDAEPLPAAGHVVQRQEEDDETLLQLQPAAIQGRRGEGGTALSPGLETAIQQARGGGQPLPETLRSRMEQALRADFSGVRVHTNAQSDQLNRALQAKAFTTGEDIFFGHGAYAPGSRGGRETLAHELTHVAQQSGRATLSRLSGYPVRVIQRLTFKEGKKRNLPQGADDAVTKFEEMVTIVDDAAKVQHRLSGEAQEVYTKAKTFVHEYREATVAPTQAPEVIKQVKKHYDKCTNTLRPALQQLQEASTQAEAAAKAKAEAMQQAGENAARAPVLLGDVETATLSAAKAMDQAMSAVSVDGAATAAAQAKAAADTARNTAVKLNDISIQVKAVALTDLYEAVDSHQKAAESAVRAAEQFSAQAERLVILSKARQAAARRPQDLQAAQAIFATAKQRAQLAAQDLTQSERVQKDLETQAAKSEGEASAEMRQQAASGVVAAKNRQQEAAQQLTATEQHVQQQEGHLKTASAEVTAAEMTIATAEPGVTGVREELQLTQTLRGLAGNQQTVDRLLALVRFNGDKQHLKAVLSDLKGAGVQTADVMTLSQLPGDAWPDDKLTALGKAAVQKNGGVSRVAHLAKAVPGLETTALVTVASIDPTRPAAYLVQLGTELVQGLPGRTADDLAALAHPQYGLSADDVVRLAKVDPTRGIDYLKQLAAIVTKLPKTRSVDDLATLADPTYQLQATKLVTIITNQIELKEFNRPQLELLIEYTGGLEGVKVVKLVGHLSDLKPQPILELLAPLHADGATGEQMYDMVDRFITAKVYAGAIKSKLTELRGNLKTPAASTVAERTSITQPGGEKKLSGPEIAALVEATATAKRKLSEVEKIYPTGQNFRDATQRDVDQLWKDCDTTATLKDAASSKNETAEQKRIRQKLALGELMRRYPGTKKRIQQIFAHDQGRTPRQFVSVAAEEGYAQPDGHVVSYHVLNGSGEIAQRDANDWGANTHTLAYRSAFKVPLCGAVASAWSSVDEANAAVQAALDALFRHPNHWPDYRDKLTKNTAFAELRHPSTAGVCLKKTDGNLTAAYTTAEWDIIKSYGSRPWIGPAHGPVRARGITHEVPVQNVTVIVRGYDSDDNAHGWAVFTAYPDDGYHEAQ